MGWRFLKRGWNALQFYLSVSDVWTLVKLAFPFMSGLLASALGYLQHSGAMYIWLGGLGAFAAAGLGLNSLSQWRSRSSPEFKLRYLRFENIAQVDPADGSHEIKYMQTNIVLDNLADFPISYKVKKFDWKIGDRVPSIKPDDEWNRGGIIEPHSPSTYRAPRINIQGLDLSEPARGTVDVEVEYGRLGREKFVWAKSINLRLAKEIPLGQTAPSYHFEWYDAPQG